MTSSNSQKQFQLRVIWDITLLTSNPCKATVIKVTWQRWKKKKKTNKEATGHNRLPRNKLPGQKEKKKKKEARGQVLSF